MSNLPVGPHGGKPERDTPPACAVLEAGAKPLPPMRWFRLYTDWLHDPKVLALPERYRSRLVQLWCVHTAERLVGASEKQLAMDMRLPLCKLKETLEILRDAGFIDDDGRPHNWDKWQMPSDRSTKRSRGCRERQKSLGGNVPGTFEERTEERRGEKSRGEETVLTLPSLPNPQGMASDKQLGMLRYRAQKKGLRLDEVATKLGLSPPFLAQDVDPLLAQIDAHPRRSPEEPENHAAKGIAAEVWARVQPLLAAHASIEDVEQAQAVMLASEPRTARDHLRPELARHLAGLGDLSGVLLELSIERAHVIRDLHRIWPLLRVQQREADGRDERLSA